MINEPSQLSMRNSLRSWLGELLGKPVCIISVEKRVNCKKIHIIKAITGPL